jgi:hypothetical protein
MSRYPAHRIQLCAGLRTVPAAVTISHILEFGMASTAIIVVSGHRMGSGSGCVANILNTLGVDMGFTGPWQTADEQPEDQEFVAVHRNIFNESQAGAYHDRAWQYPQPRINLTNSAAWLAIAKARAEKPVWGFKDPRFPFVMSFGIGTLLALGVDVRLVWLYRNLRDVASSLARRDGGSFDDNFRISQVQERQWAAMYAQYSDFQRVMLSYEDLIARPRDGVLRLTDILPDACDYSQEAVEVAAASINVK